MFLLWKSCVLCRVTFQVQVRQSWLCSMVECWCYSFASVLRSKELVTGEGVLEVIFPNSISIQRSVFH